jgi:uncharacterized membrane protein
MNEDEQYPERGYTTEDVAAIREAAPPPQKTFFRRHWGKSLIAAIVGIPIVTFALWSTIALLFVYSSGDRAGYIQKFSKKGWICKTYEGEIAMVNVPGQIANTFQFTVRDDSIAALINKFQGQRVAISYDEHRGIPTSCFGETNYFVKGVRSLGP